jgi:protocatechuate 3,4-dioxygenase beta subunit
MFVSISLGNAQEEAPFPTPPRDVSSIATLASEEEPGEPLVITGTIFRSDKKTPYESLVLYFYQTDATGVYNKINGSWKSPRLHGWAKTDAKGGYEIHTVKPGSYPGSRNPAHIHVIISLPGQKARWLDDFLFEGDPYLRSEDLRKAERGGGFANIMKVTSEEGKVRCARNFVITGQ